MKAADGHPRLTTTGTEHPVIGLRLHDGFVLRHRGRAVCLPWAAQRLLAYLVVAGRPRQRQRIASVLWPDAPRERGLASVRTALWEIRRRAPAVQDDGLLSVPEHVDVDHRTARTVLEELLLGRPVGRPAEAVVGVLSGELLPDWSEDWLDAERTAFDQDRVRGLELLCRQCIEAGCLATAFRAADLAVRIDPLRESARRALISVELAEGNDCCARRSFERYRALLEEELGASPARGWEALRASVATCRWAG